MINTTNLTVLECAVNERNYQLLCSTDSPLIDVREAINKFSSHLLEIEEKLKINKEEIK